MNSALDFILFLRWLYSGQKLSIRDFFRGLKLEDPTQCIHVYALVHEVKVESLKAELLQYLTFWSTRTQCMTEESLERTWSAASALPEIRSIIADAATSVLVGERNVADSVQDIYRKLLKSFHSFAIAVAEESVKALRLSLAKHNQASAGLYNSAHTTIQSLLSLDRPFKRLLWPSRPKACLDLHQVARHLLRL